MRLGIDIGGTKTEAVVITDDGTLVRRAQLPTGMGPEAVVAGAIAAAQQASEGADFDAVGVGIPGVVEGGRVRHAVNIGVADLDLAGVLGERLGVPATIENDVKAATLGAYRLAGHTGSLAYLNLGTGIAAGLMLAGRLWRGPHGVAGEIGHIAVDPSGDLCQCGQRGCLETLASGAAVARAWPTVVGSPVLALFDAADAGDPKAVAARERFLGAVAAGVRLLVLTVDVERVILGGGVTDVGDRLLDVLRARLRVEAGRSAFLNSLGLPERVGIAPRDRPVAAIGAALLGYEPA